MIGLVCYYAYFSCEEAGKLLKEMILQVEKTIRLFQRLPNPPDEKLGRIERVLKELKNDYLPKHLHW